ncbi:hypothetical protein P4S73_16480 [Paraglaciecola sp. Hal342]
MELKNLFKASAVATALLLAGCGGDIKVTPTVIDNSVDNSVTNPTTGGGDSGSTNVCASYENTSGETVQGSYDGTDCTYNTAFVSASNPITTDVTLTDLSNDGVHLFLGSLVMGEGCNNESDSCSIDTDGPTLTVDAGADVAFNQTTSFILINRGANIEAEGTYADPITFTSSNAYARLDAVGSGPQYQDWGGIMIDGLGITDQCTDAQRAAATCNAVSEGVTSFYGGNDNTDNSGTLKFVKIHYAGGLPSGAEAGNDLNSLSLFAVGSGTEIDYIDIYQGYDDGIEFFGGAVDIKHIVITDTQDDSLDIDAGWQGRAQYVLIKQGTVVNNSGETVSMGNGGFESDGVKGESSAEAPASAPVLANVTVITTDNISVRDGDPSIAMKLDDMISATWYNTLLVKPVATQTWCINYSGDAAEVIVNGSASIHNSVAACAQLANAGSETVTSGSDSTTVQEWFEANSSEVVGGNVDVLAANGFATLTTSTDITISAFDASTLDAFFEATDFIGAISDTDTTSDWYNWANDAFVNAAADE